MPAGPVSPDSLRWSSREPTRGLEGHTDCHSPGRRMGPIVSPVADGGTSSNGSVWAAIPTETARAWGRPGPSMYFQPWLSLDRGAGSLSSGLDSRFLQSWLPGAHECSPRLGRFQKRFGGQDCTAGPLAFSKGRSASKDQSATPGKVTARRSHAHASVFPQNVSCGLCPVALHSHGGLRRGCATAPAIYILPSPASRPQKLVPLFLHHSVRHTQP